MQFVVVNMSFEPNGSPTGQEIGPCPQGPINMPAKFHSNMVEWRTGSSVCLCEDVLLHDSPKTTSESPLLFVVFPTPKGLFFFLISSSQVVFTRTDLYVVLGWWHGPNTVGAAIFYWSLCLQSIFISRPNPPEASPLLTIKGAPSPPPQPYQSSLITHYIC